MVLVLIQLQIGIQTQVVVIPDVLLINVTEQVLILIIIAMVEVVQAILSPVLLIVRQTNIVPVVHVYLDLVVLHLVQLIHVVGVALDVIGKIIQLHAIDIVMVMEIVQVVVVAILAEIRMIAQLIVLDVVKHGFLVFLNVAVMMLEKIGVQEVIKLVITKFITLMGTLTLTHAIVEVVHG